MTIGFVGVKPFVLFRENRCFRLEPEFVIFMADDLIAFVPFIETIPHGSIQSASTHSYIYIYIYISYLGHI